MNITFISFGETLINIRKKLGFSQDYISKLAKINPETLRRIESNKVIPKFETLELLSPIYKKDLNSLFLSYRTSDPSYFYGIKNRLERKFDRDEFFSLGAELKELNIILNYTENISLKNLINQLVLLTEAVILYKDNNNNNNTALTKLIEAIKITSPYFDLADYELFVYSSMEIRILMNIGFIFNRFNDKKKYLEIMEFCMDSIDINDGLYSKLCHNLSTAYYRNEDYKRALDFANKGIESCKESRNLHSLGYLYYGKGCAKYRLNEDSFMDSLNMAVTLCKAFGQDNLEETIKNNCKKFFDIDL